jgi:hypothetical protein
MEIEIGNNLTQLLAGVITFGFFGWIAYLLFR